MEDVKRLPAIQAAGLDIGATKTHMRFVPADGDEPVNITLKTGTYGSLEELISTAFLQAGCFPKRLVAGAAGRVEPNGDLKLTNHNWPVFRHQSFVEDLGIELKIVNDIHSQLAGVDAIGVEGRQALTPNVPEPATKAKVMAAMGSGVGVAFMDPRRGIHPTELGHISWQPVTDLEYEFLRELQSSQPGVVITVEEAAGGLLGFDRMYDFISKRVAPSDEVLRHVDELRGQRKPVGPAVSVGAMAGDKCCLEIFDLYGAIIGQFLRDVALGALVADGGAVYLSGGVMQSNRGAQTVFEQTSFRDRFISRGAQHADFLAAIPFYLVTDPYVAVKGAYELASSAG